VAVRRNSATIGLAAVVAVLVVVNGFEPFGQRAASWVDNLLQLSAGVTAAVCGFAVARRYNGPQRWWRLLTAVGMTCWSGGQVMWSWYQLFDNRGLPSPSLADVGYLLLPVFVLPALLVLATARAEPSPRTAHFGTAVVLDGLVVTGSLFILAWEVALGRVVHAHLPDALTWAVAIAYPITDLIMVTVAVLLVVFDRFDRRNQANLLLLALGVVALACSDSIFVYLVSIGAESMKPLADAGFVLGPLLIGYALLAMPAERSKARHPDSVDWWKFVLPYLPVMAVGGLFTVQLLSGGISTTMKSVLPLTIAVVVLAAAYSVRVSVELTARLTQTQHQAGELAASRTRIVQAQVTERRRIEHHLHDGIQQDLVALLAKLRLARNTLSSNADRTGAVLTEAQDDVYRVIDELRELAHGIHPAELTDQGLVAAVRSRARRAPISVAVHTEAPVDGRRFTADIEESAFYLISEALTNVLKHARATQVSIRLSLADGTLIVEVADDGIGIPLACREGSGLTGLRDRVAATSGTFEVINNAKGGTTVRAQLPAQEATSDASARAS
jgi:signal transduction histidine kinase